MLELLDELTARLGEGVVEIDIAIPRRHQQARRRAGGKGDGGDGIGGVLGKLKLAFAGGQRRSWGGGEGRTRAGRGQDGGRRLTGHDCAGVARLWMGGRKSRKQLFTDRPTRLAQ